MRITLIGKPGCHLCDDARAEIEAVRQTLAEGGVRTELAELNILEDEGLARLHSEDIPVVLVGDRRHAIWRVDRAKLADAVRKEAARTAVLPRFSLRRR